MSETNPEITIRPLRADDHPAVRALWEAAGVQARTTGRDAPNAFAAQLAEFPRTYLGAEADGRLIGVVLGTHDHRKGWINHLAVHPDYRRHGLGLRLLRACEMALEQSGIEIIAALIEEGNSPSVALFERGGYLADVPVHYYRRLRRPDI